MNHLGMLNHLARATADTGTGGFDLRTLLLFVGGAVLLAFFSSLGLIARIREHRLEQRRAAADRQSESAARQKRSTDDRSPN